MSTEGIKTITQFMNDYSFSDDTEVIKLYFLTDKAAKRSYDDNMITWYVHPVTVIYRSKGEWHKLPEEVGIIKFLESKHREVDENRIVNCLLIKNETKKFQGKEYFPSRILNNANEIPFTKAIYNKYQNTEPVVLIHRAEKYLVEYNDDDLV